MIRGQFKFLGVLIGALLGPFFQGPEAGAITWSVKNLAGTTTYCSGSGTPTANLPATCNANLDFVSSGGTARIEAIDGGNNDILKLANTKIVAKNTITDYVLTFEHDFAPGPSSAIYTPIYYNTRMKGRFSGSSASNKITSWSIVEHPVGTPLFISSQLVAPPPNIFDYQTSPGTPNSMSGTRKVILKVKFSLASGMNIDFPTSSDVVRVSAQMNPDECPDEEDGLACSKSEHPTTTKPTNPMTSLLSELSGLLIQGSKACLGISSQDGECIGMQIVK